MLGYVAQEQERGVWHFHLALGYHGGGQGALDAYVDGMQLALLRHGFGPKFDRGRRSEKPGALATYMARYLSPSRYGEGFLRVLRSVEHCDRMHRLEGDERTVLRPVYVSPALMRRSGRTMGLEAYKRRHWRAHGNQPLQRVFCDYIEQRGKDERRAARRRGPPLEIPELELDDVHSEPESTWEQVALWA